MKSLAPFKRGDTLILTCVYKIDGAAQSIDDLDIVSQCRKLNGDLVFNFDVVKNSSVLGQFVMTPDVDTNILPLAQLKIDIEIRDNDFVRSSQTFILPVIEDITR